MFQEIYSKIAMAADKKLPRAITEAAEEYDNIMLDYAIVPDEGIEFLLTVFSCKRVLHAKGLEHFLLEINVDLIKYTHEHRMKLLKVLVENAQYVSDQLARHSIGDFIARAYTADLAFKVFIQLSKGTPEENHIAFVGLDVLKMRESKASLLYKKIESKWAEMIDAFH